MQVICDPLRRPGPSSYVDIQSQAHAQTDENKTARQM